MVSKKAESSEGEAEGGSRSKSEFIRQHPELSVAELVAKAKEAGMTLAPNLVYAVRARLRATPAPGTESPPPSKPRRASDFIREQLGRGLSPSEVMAAGAREGIRFSANLVYAVKSKLGTTGASRKRAAEPREDGDEVGFKRLAAELGLRRSRQLLDELERDLRRLLES